MDEENFYLFIDTVFAFLVSSAYVILYIIQKTNAIEYKIYFRCAIYIESNTYPPRAISDGMSYVKGKRHDLLNGVLFSNKNQIIWKIECECY